MHPAPCGWYWSSPISKADALNEVDGRHPRLLEGQDRRHAVDRVCRHAVARVRPSNPPYKANGMGMPRIIATAAAPRRDRDGLGAGTTARSRSRSLPGRWPRTPSWSRSTVRTPATCRPSRRRLRALYPTAAAGHGAWGTSGFESRCRGRRGQPAAEPARGRAPAPAMGNACRPVPRPHRPGVTLTGFDRFARRVLAATALCRHGHAGTDATTFDWWAESLRPPVFIPKTRARQPMPYRKPDRVRGLTTSAGVGAIILEFDVVLATCGSRTCWRTAIPAPS